MKRRNFISAFAALAMAPALARLVPAIESKPERIEPVENLDEEAARFGGFIYGKWSEERNILVMPTMFGYA